MLTNNRKEKEMDISTGIAKQILYNGEGKYINEMLHHAFYGIAYHDESSMSKKAYEVYSNSDFSTYIYRTCGGDVALNVITDHRDGTILASEMCRDRQESIEFFNAFFENVLEK